jgi:hypothetical protein
MLYHYHAEQARRYSEGSRLRLLNPGGPELKTVLLMQHLAAMQHPANHLLPELGLRCQQAQAGG